MRCGNSTHTCVPACNGKSVIASIPRCQLRGSAARLEGLAHQAKPPSAKPPTTANRAITILRTGRVRRRTDQAAATIGATSAASCRVFFRRPGSCGRAAGAPSSDQAADRPWVSPDRWLALTSHDAVEDRGGDIHWTLGAVWKRLTTPKWSESHRPHGCTCSFKITRLSSICPARTKM